jgi:uncharacterized membrane-anchored protein YhcB (DUF1043 family)
METLWMTFGGIFVPVGFSLFAIAQNLPTQPNHELALVGLIMGLIGILGIIRSYQLTIKKERKEDDKFKDNKKLINSAIDELKTNNSNIVSLLNEIRQDRNERNKSESNPNDKPNP